MKTRLICNDAVLAIARLDPHSVDVIWADPPYWLSSGGSTCRGGKRVSVNKGAWDLPKTPDEQLEWARAWLDQARHVLKPTGTLWVCGSLHSIHTAGYALQLENYRLLNEIAWEKPNPPPNLGCRPYTSGRAPWNVPPRA